MCTVYFLMKWLYYYAKIEEYKPECFGLVLHNDLIKWMPLNLFSKWNSLLSSMQIFNNTQMSIRENNWVKL